MQSLLSGHVMMYSIKLDENQLTELSQLARQNPTKEGCLCKVDTKGRRGTEKLCVLHHNMMFYFDPSSCSKPTGVIFLEGCHCYPIVAELAQNDYPSSYDVECGLSIGYKKDGISRHYVFLCRNLDERSEWISVINNSSMAKLRVDYEALKIRCHHLESKLSSAGTEVVNLRKQHSDAQENIASLRANLPPPQVKRSKSVGGTGMMLFSLGDPNFLKFKEVHEDYSARILQRHIRGWLIRRRWQRVVHSYINSPHSGMMRKRNQLIWKLVASEEDYVSQLTVLRGEFQQQMMIAACSLKPYLSLEQCMDIFRNSDELSLFHQLYLRALHRAVEKWPVVNLGEVFKLFTPMLAVYHQYIGNHRYSLEVLFELKLHRQSFKTFLETLEKKPVCKNMSLEELLTTPLNRLTVYIQEIEELRAHTPPEHVDYRSMSEAISELEMIQKTVTDEVSFSESIRQVLAVERKIEGGCEVLIDKEQSLIRKGFLLLYKGDEKTPFKSRKSSTYCFLFSKHFVVTQRLAKRKEEIYRIQKEVGILPLAKCKVKDHTKSERPELRYLGIIIEYDNGETKAEFQFLAMGVSEKAQWMADIAQCIVNEKENIILESQSKGEMVELSSNFIRYSTFRAGKEQLVNSGNLQNLLNRLIRVSYMGLEFLNTFLTTFTMYTSSTTVMDFLEQTYEEVLKNRSRKGAVISPEEQVKEARTMTFPAINSGSVATSMSLPVTFPRRSPKHVRSNGISQTENPLTSVTGIFFALKHWVCKHFHHFRNSSELDNKLQKILDSANQTASLTHSERKAVTDLSSLYAMQKKGEFERPCPIIKYIDDHQQNIQNTKQISHTTFSVLLQWDPRSLAEQLCLIEGALLCRIDNDELLRYINSSVDDRKSSAPNIVRIIKHFNRMSMYWIWAFVKQASDSDRIKVLELLIQCATECLQLSNFMSLMEIVGALEHSCLLRFTSIWNGISKSVKMQHRALKKVASTDGRYKELREAIKRATPPVLPYLGITLAELVSIKEAMPTYVEGDQINFTKMRRLTKIISVVLQHHKDPFEFTLSNEVAKQLLCTPIQEDQDALYCYVDSIKPSNNLSITSAQDCNNKQTY